MMKKWIYLAALLSTSAMAAPTQPGLQIDKQLTDCQQQAVSTLANSECYSTAIKAWDGELNRQYKALLEGQPEKVQQALKASQRAWVSYRDSYFNAMNAYYSQQDGTIWGLVAADSHLQVIKDKALDLWRLRNSTDLSGGEG